MKLLSLRQSMAATPHPNSEQSAWLLMDDSEEVVRYDEFDGHVYLLIAKVTEPEDLDDRLFRDRGDLDHEYLPEWVDTDDNGIIVRIGEETGMQAFARQWTARSAR